MRLGPIYGKASIITSLSPTTVGCSAPVGSPAKWSAASGAISCCRRSAGSVRKKRCARRCDATQPLDVRCRLPGRSRASVEPPACNRPWKRRRRSYSSSVMLARVELHDEDLGLTVYLAVDRLSDGWCAGGLRFAPSVTPAQLERLARLMTLKFGALGVRIGGAKAGIVGTPQGQPALAMLLRAAELLEPFLRSWYMMGEDLGTRGDDIARMYAHVALDPIAIVHKRAAAAGVTLMAPPGLKPADLFGDQFAGRVAGDGVVAATLAAAQARGLRPESLDVSLQGFGSVGLSAAQGFVKHGLRLVAVADTVGCVCAPLGLDVVDLARARNPWGVIDRRRLRQRVTHLRREDWCRVPADVLVPAAAEGGGQAGGGGAGVADFCRSGRRPGRLGRRLRGPAADQPGAQHAVVNAIVVDGGTHHPPP